MKPYYRRCMVVLFGLVLVFGGLPSICTLHAQEEEKATYTLDEIVVTAERRESNAQDTPISVSAWDNSELEEQAIEGFVDLQMRMVSTTF